MGGAQGPGRDSAEKRLAVLVEDHPVEYGDFEGIIPEGSYGAGATIIWDRGTWVPLADPLEGLESGKLLFELRGHKLHGVWTLVKLRNSERDWLLIKERDPYTASTDDFPPGSVLSGRTVQELLDGRNRAAQIRTELERLGAPRRVVPAESLKPMLAETREQPFSRAGWVFELKYDGWRMLAAHETVREETGRSAGEARLFLRSGQEATAAFPELAHAVAALPYERLIMDGEVVVLDERGRPSFQRLQSRARLTRMPDIRRASRELPAVLYAFDLLAFEDFDLRPLPLVQRKALLARITPPAGSICYSDHIEREGMKVFQAAVRLGIEGIVAKKADSPYRTGRSAHWLKVRESRTGDFVIVGYALPKGSRVGFGALHLAVFDDGRLIYAGRAGTGFNDRQLRELRDELDAMRRPDPPCEGSPAGPEHVWVEPERVAEVRYMERTDDGLLRQPVFLRLRPDKAPSECVRGPRREEPEELPASAALPDGFGDAERESVDAPADVRPAAGVEATPSVTRRTPYPDASGSPSARGAEATPPATSANPRQAAGQGTRATPGTQAARAKAEDTREGDPRTSGAPRAVAFTNPDKVFWPDEGYTKGDLIEYYRAVAPSLLTYLRDRPLVMTRHPDGIAGKSFFQKDAPGFAPQWLRTVRVWSDDSQRELNYFVCDDEASLLYVVNLGTIPLHLWASRVGSLQNPDWCILDLDPKGAPFTDVVKVAKALRALCAEIDLPCFAKTSGSSGLHVLVPLGGRCTFKQSRLLAELLARVIVEELPEIATLARVISRREGKVYLDYLQNGEGKLLVAPFSVRPRPGATASTPLEWHEVDSRLDPSRFTIRTVPRRLRRMERDPMQPLVEIGRAHV